MERFSNFQIFCHFFHSYRDRYVRLYRIHYRFFGRPLRDDEIETLEANLASNLSQDMKRYA